MPQHIPLEGDYKVVWVVFSRQSHRVCQLIYYQLPGSQDQRDPEPEIENICWFAKAMRGSCSLAAVREQWQQASRAQSKPIVDAYFSCPSQGLTLKALQGKYIKGYWVAGII